MPTLQKTIILEGANGSGKSTLAKELAKKYNLRIYHSIRPATALEAIYHAYTQYELCKYPAILDRSHPISRLVYQTDTIGILEREILEVIASHQALCATVIYCTGQGERDTNKPHYTKELIKETQDQDKIREQYDYIFDVLKHQKYNFKNDEISSLQLT